MKIRKILFILSIQVCCLNSLAQDNPKFYDDKTNTIKEPKKPASNWTGLRPPPSTTATETPNKVDTVLAPGMTTISPPNIIIKDSETNNPIQKNNKDNKNSVDSRSLEKKDSLEKKEAGVQIK